MHMDYVQLTRNVRDKKARDHDTLNEGKSDMAVLKEWAELEERERGVKDCMVQI